MRTIRALTILAAFLALPLGCDDDGTETGDPQPQPAATPELAETATVDEEEEAPIPELEVAQVATLLAAGDCIVVDANGASTRGRYGAIPGATILTSSGRYDPAEELPEDHAAKLVFYCANEDCSASDGAAGRARTAGFSDVNVMRAGIAGWTEAGKETTPVS